MKKLRIVLLFVLLLAVIFAFTACDANDATSDNEANNSNSDTEKTPEEIAAEEAAKAETAKKEAVLATLNSATAPDDDTATPAPMPELPTVDEAVSAIFTAFGTTTQLGTIDFSAPFMDLPPMSGPVTIKDGSIVFTDEESGMNIYLLTDENKNIAIVVESEGTIISATPLSLQALLDKLDRLADMTVPDEDTTVPGEDTTVTTPAIPEFEIPEITIDDLVVNGNRVSISPEYLKSLVDIIVPLVYTAPEQEATMAQTIAAIKMMLSSMKIDIYATLNDSLQIIGFGLDFDLHEAEELVGIGPLKISADVTFNPTTNALGALTLAVESDAVNADIRVQAISIGDMLVSLEVDYYVDFMTTEWDPETEESMSLKNIVEGEVAFHLTALGATESDILTVSVKYSNEIDVDGAPVTVEVASGDLKISNTDVGYALSVLITMPGEEERLTMLDVTITWDLTATDITLEIPENITGVMDKVANYLSKSEEISAITSQMRNIDTNNIAYEDILSEYYYYDENTNAYFIVEITTYNEETGITGWTVTSGFAPEAMQDVTMIWDAENQVFILTSFPAI